MSLGGVWWRTLTFQEPISSPISLSLSPICRQECKLSAPPAAAGQSVSMILDGHGLTLTSYMFSSMSCFGNGIYLFEAKNSN